MQVWRKATKRSDMDNHTITRSRSAARRRRHLRLEALLGAAMLVVGTALNLTVIGLVVGIPLAIAGFGLLTTPDPS